MDWNMVLTAILRKVVFISIVYTSYFLFDRLELRGFKTREVLKDAPIALAIFYAGFFIGLAYA